MRNKIFNFKGLFLVCVLSIIFFQLGVSTQASKSSGETPQTAPLTTTKKPTPTTKSVEVLAIQLEKFFSPQGRFEVLIPKGWRFKTYAADESSIAFVPPDKDLPEIGIALTEATALANMMGILYGGYNAPVSAQQFFEFLYIPLVKQTVPDLQVESISAPRQELGEMIATGTYLGKKYKGKVSASMEYLRNPVAGNWYSFVLLNSIISEPTQSKLVEADLIATGIFNSFKPTSRWGEEVGIAISGGLHAQQNIVSGSMARLKELEMEARKLDGINPKIARGWIDAPGGTAELKDSSGNIYRTYDEYKYYYKGDKGDVMGTDDPSELSGREQLYR